MSISVSTALAFRPESHVFTGGSRCCYTRNHNPRVGGSSPSSGIALLAGTSRGCWGFRGFSCASSQLLTRHQGLLEPDARKRVRPVLRGPDAAMCPAYPSQSGSRDMLVPSARGGCDMNVLIVGAGVIGTVYGAQLGARVTASRSLRTVIAWTRSPLVAYTPGTSPPASRRRRRPEWFRPRESRMSMSCWSPCGVIISRARPVRSPKSRPARWCSSWATTRPDARAFLAGQALGSRSASPVLAGRSAPVSPPTTKSPSSRRQSRRLTSRVSQSSQTPLPRAGCQSSAWLTWMAGWPITRSSSSRSAPRCTAAGPTQSDSRDDRATLKLMCLAITQGFQELHASHIKGCPRNLAVLHNRWLAPAAIRYWARVMRSPMGELAFAARASRETGNAHTRP